MILSPPFPPRVWGAALLTEPAVELPDGLYADELADALGTGAALDDDDFFAEHDDDVLALPYYVPLPDGSRWYGRLSQKAGHVCLRARCTPLATWVFVDLDPPGGAGAWPTLPDPSTLDLPAFVWCAYTTPKGLRLVVDTEPFPVTHYHSVYAWVAAQVGTVEVNGRTLAPDPSSDQWNRLQRLPHATRRDGKYPDLDGSPLPSNIYIRPTR